MSQYRDIKLTYEFRPRYLARDYESYLQKFVLKNYCGPIERITVAVTPMDWMVQIDFAGIDTRTNQPHKFSLMRKIILSEYRDWQECFDRFLRSLIREVVLHEIDECLLKDGEHLVNPHPEVPDYARPFQPA